MYIHSDIRTLEEHQPTWKRPLDVYNRIWYNLLNDCFVGMTLEHIFTLASMFMMHCISNCCLPGRKRASLCKVPCT